jgi:serpin B
MSATLTAAAVLADLIGAPESVEEQNHLYAEVLKSVNGEGERPFQLVTANALWGQKGFPWRAEWLGLQNDRFGAGFNEVDFEKDKGGSIARINGWVDERTRGKIRDLLKPEDVPVNERAQITRLILTNAIYFKGDWSLPFDRAGTKEAAFRRTSSGCVSCT